MLAPWKREAEEWLERLAEDHPEEFFQALRDLIEDRFPRGPGRQPGTGGVDDTARIDRLVDLLRSDEGLDRDEAIRLVAREDPGDSEKNTRRRLRNKFSQVEARLEDTREAEKAEILRRAFEEDFETWDL